MAAAAARLSNLVAVNWPVVQFVPRYMRKNRRVQSAGLSSDRGVSLMPATGKRLFLGR